MIRSPALLFQHDELTAADVDTLCETGEVVAEEATREVEYTGILFSGSVVGDRLEDSRCIGDPHDSVDRRGDERPTSFVGGDVVVDTLYEAIFGIRSDRPRLSLPG